MALDKPKLADVGALIRGGKLREGTIPICLAGDLVGEWEALDVQRRQADKTGDGSLSGGPAAAIVARMEELRGPILESTVEFRLRAVTNRRWLELVALHPPRKDNEGNVIRRDILVQVNYDTFFEALLPESIIDPVLDADTLRLLLDERLTHQQYEDLTTMAWNLNQSSVNVPFSPAVSPNRTNSSTT